MITHLYGIYYPDGSCCCGSIKIEHATSKQIVQRIQMVETHLVRLSLAKMDKNRRQSLENLNVFIQRAEQEIIDLIAYLINKGKTLV